MHGLVGEGDGDALRPAASTAPSKAYSAMPSRSRSPTLRPSRTSMPRTVSQGLSCRPKAISPMPSTTVSLLAHTDSRTGARSARRRSPSCVPAALAVQCVVRDQRVRRAPGRPCRRPLAHRPGTEAVHGRGPLRYGLPGEAEHRPAHPLMALPAGPRHEQRARRERAGGSTLPGRRPVNRPTASAATGTPPKEHRKARTRVGTVPSGQGCPGPRRSHRGPTATPGSGVPPPAPGQPPPGRPVPPPSAPGVRAARCPPPRRPTPPSVPRYPPAPSPHDRAAGQHDAPRPIRSAVSSQRTHRPPGNPHTPRPSPLRAEFPA
ncbi:hypothetical protein SGLAM104S_03801 [Streptomyces glaucescens]